MVRRRNGRPYVYKEKKYEEGGFGLTPRHEDENEQKRRLVLVWLPFLRSIKVLSIIIWPSMAVNRVRTLMQITWFSFSLRSTPDPPISFHCNILVVIPVSVLSYRTLHLLRTLIRILSFVVPY